MAFYEKEPNQLLIDLINEANPDVDIDLRTLQNTLLGTPHPYPSLRNQQTLRVVKAFTGVGVDTWTPPHGVSKIDVMIIAAGGGGGYRPYTGYATAGGGAGGLVFIPDYPVSGVYAVNVGAGGAPGYNGDDTTFGEELRALGGGAGASAYNPTRHDGADGGSGGGSLSNITTPAEIGHGKQKRLFGLSGKYGHGSDGGYHLANDPAGSGGTPFGGGGAGDSASGLYQGNTSGGDGLDRVDPTMGPYLKEHRFAEVFGLAHGERIGADVWFGGGGGGGRGLPSNGGKGGGGRGGTYRYSYSSTAGRHNTGGGGGGATQNHSGYYASSGGHGVVLIAYDNPRVNLPGLKYQDVDTELNIHPTPELPFKGKVTLYYRRINLQNLFRNREVRFDHWIETEQITTENVIEHYNREFGTQLVVSDFPNAAYGPSSALRSIPVDAGSYTYTGALQFYWNPGKRDLPNILDTNVVSGYWWAPEATHQVAIGSKPTLTHLGWGFNYTRYTGNLYSSIANATIASSTPYLRQLIGLYNRINGTDLSMDRHYTQEDGIRGLVLTKYSTGSVPECNNQRFQNVIRISSHPDAWFTGHILMHFIPKY